MSKIVYAKTHAEFLNKVFKTNYAGYGRGRWPYDSDTWVWMVRMDDTVREGWVNKIIDTNTIWEEYVWPGTPSYSAQSERKYRIAVRIVDAARGREYHILGKYVFDFNNSTMSRHILKKVADIY